MRICREWKICQILYIIKSSSRQFSVVVSKKVVFIIHGISIGMLKKISIYINPLIKLCNCYKNINYYIYTMYNQSSFTNVYKNHTSISISLWVMSPWTLNLLSFTSSLKDRGERKSHSRAVRYTCLCFQTVWVTWYSNVRMRFTKTASVTLAV